MDAIRLEINMGTKSAPQWTDVYLGDDVSFSMESNSPIWNDNAVFSEGLAISVIANNRIFGNSDELRGESIYAMIYHRQFRLWVSGVVFQTGIIDLDDEVEIDDDGMLEITLQGGQKEFDDILKDVNAQDVPIYTPGADDNVLIGYTTDTDYIKVSLDVEEKYLEAHPVKYKYTDDAKKLSTRKTYDNVFITMPHVLRNVYAWGKYFEQTDNYRYVLRTERAGSGSDDCTNTSLPYPQKPYCNVRLCHPRYSETGGSWQMTVEDRKKGPQCHEAWMLNSAPCFFVHYWVKRLFDALGIAVEQDDLSSIPDFDRLAFYHTNAEYEMEKDTDGRHFVFPYPEMRDFDGTKDWLEKSLERMAQNYSWYQGNVGSSSDIDKIKKNIEAYLKDYIGLSLDVDSSPIVIYPKTITRADGTTFENVKGRRWQWRKELTVKSVRMYGDAPALYKAYATGRNFPDTEASAIIEGIEKGFCVRFIYDNSGSRVRIVYLKDVLGSLDVIPFMAIPSEPHKRENYVRGVRLKYGSSEKAKRNGITKVDDLTGQQTGVDSDNSGVATSFNYNDYTQLRSFNDYAKVIANIGCTDQTLKYVTTTGNKYRTKVEQGAKTDLELWPSLLEVGGYSDVELGDCSDDDFVEEISIGFSPMIENDANYHNEREAVTGSMDSSNAEDEDDIQNENDDNADFSTPSIKPIYASFVDAELHPAQETLSYLTFDKCFSPDTEGYPHRKSDSVRKFQMKTVVTGGVWLDEHYNIEQSANSPYYKNDAGFTLGVLRESPDENGLIVYDYDYDGKGNSKWRYVSNKDGCFTSDSIDHFGNALCHHDGKPSMSLKLRVETRNPYWDEKTKTCSRYEDITDLNTGFFIISDSNNARRGLYNLVYTDYCYWLLHRKVAVFTFDRGAIELGELLSIDYCKKYRIDGIEGFINKVSYDFDMDGLNSATIELYYL